MTDYNLKLILRLILPLAEDTTESQLVPNEDNFILSNLN